MPAACHCRWAWLLWTPTGTAPSSATALPTVIPQARSEVCMPALSSLRPLSPRGLSLLMTTLGVVWAPGESPALPAMESAPGTRIRLDLWICNSAWQLGAALWEPTRPPFHLAPFLGPTVCQGGEKGGREESGRFPSWRDSAGAGRCPGMTIPDSQSHLPGVGWGSLQRARPHSECRDEGSCGPRRWAKHRTGSLILSGVSGAPGQRH